jgi:WD40 repeat protein
MIQSPYQVGGSLSTDAPSYIKRQADYELYEALKRGEFCYVLNARQMGKSSLMVRTQHRLQQEGYCCAAIDLSVIGSEEITPLQWYKGIITSLALEFDIFGEFNLKSWWKAEEDLSFVHRFSRFIDLLLEVYLPQEQIYIFIDEVDSILHLDFSVDDFFASIRSFYNQRANHPDYQRISFTILGVATPSDLIQDKRRTPFNIGTAIELKGFTWDEAKPLAKNFKMKSGCAKTVLKEILHWTAGQPFLTQKLCDLVIKNSLNSYNNLLEIGENQEKEWVDQLVRSRILENWEAQDEPEHLKTIQDRILNNPNSLGRLLGIYQKILQNLASEQQLKVKLDDSRETLELILSGLVIKDKGYLKVKNLIYAAIFNLQWIQYQFDQIRPYSQLLEAWNLSNYQDDSRLLRGQSLKEAQEWAVGKSLSDLDYRFLGASQQYDDREIRKTLQAERSKEIEARLVEERKTAKVQQFFLEKVRKETEARLAQEQNQRIKTQEIYRLQQLFIKGIWGVFITAIILFLIILLQFLENLSVSKVSRLQEVKALTSSSEAFFASEQNLEALIAAIQANQKLKLLDYSDSEYPLQQQVKTALEQAVFNIYESNHLSGHYKGIIGMNFSHQGKALETFISASKDQTIKLWNRQGYLLRTLVHHETLQAVGFSPEGNRFAVGDQTNLIKIYNQNGGILNSIVAQKPNVSLIALSGNNQTLAAVSGRNTVQLWTQTGNLLATFQPKQGLIHRLAISPNGEIVATGGEDNQVKLWDRQGNLIQTLPDYYPAAVNPQQTIIFSPDNQLIAIASPESTVNVYSVQGALLTRFKTHQSIVNSLVFSPDSQTLAIAGLDSTIQVWSRTGNLLKNLVSYAVEMNSMAFSPDGKTLASSTTDGSIYFWQLHHPLKKTIFTDQEMIQTIQFSPDSQQFTTACYHGIVKRWQRDGRLIESISINEIKTVNLEGQHLLKLLIKADPLSHSWTINAQLINRLITQTGWVEAVAIHPQNRLIATRNSNNKLQFWNAQGNLQQQISPTQTEISEIAFSPDGEVFGLSGNQGVELWEMKGQLPKQLIHSEAKIQTWRFSGDGKIIAIADATGEITLWNQTGQLLSTIDTETEAVVDLAISSDGQLLAIIDHQSPTAIQLWNSEGQLLQTLRGNQAQFNKISFSPEADLLVSANRSGEVVLWDLQSILNTDLLNLACDWVQDYLKTHETLPQDQRNLCQPKN